MSELVTFLLPPLLALVGVRGNLWLFGPGRVTPPPAGLTFALGLATGMLLFSQLIVVGAVAGINLAPPLAYVALCWGVIELLFHTLKNRQRLRRWRPRRAHLWALALLPTLGALIALASLSVVEGMREYDGIAFWVFKAKVMFLRQGEDFLAVHQNPTLAYAHWDYPLLVPALYTLGYGLDGNVHEFTIKVWPFWMLTALLVAILSWANFSQRPRLLPVAAVTILCFLPMTLRFVRMEGGTIPMAFFSGMLALVAARLFLDRDGTSNPGALTLLLAGSAATKFEGMIYAGVWAIALSVVVWRRRWWQERSLRLGVLAGALCLVPYLAFRFTGPVLHPESGWLPHGLSDPAEALKLFPVVWVCSLAFRFFSKEGIVFEFSPDGSLEHFGTGRSIGMLLNEDLGYLPWGLLVLTVFTLWRRKDSRVSVLAVVGVLLATTALISLAIACLPRMQSDWNQAVQFARDMVGRYFYPFFVAWFIGLLAPWLHETPPDGPERTPNTPPAHASPAARAPNGSALPT